MNLHLYNTLSRTVEEFEPLNPAIVGVYTCGPTVYHHAHLGNLRTYIASDILVRVLKLNGYAVRHVMNITDVGHLVSDADEGEDKIEIGAAREGLTAWQIAERYTQSFFEQSQALNIARPDVVCRATDHIPQQVAMIEALKARGYVYRTDDGLYFDTQKVPSYGDFARLDLSGLRAGVRVDLGMKRSKTNFALWKFSRGAKRQMEWDSPWGVGFPGWHIECSAMSTYYLGNCFDIHTGGIDHIPVHHTNEIAQSESATGCRPFVRYWMHSNFLQLGDDKRMAKSSNEFLTVAALVEKGYEPLRSQMTFSWNALSGVSVQYRRLRAHLAELQSRAGDGAADQPPSPSAQPYADAIMSALNDDLATPVALTTLQQALADDALTAVDKVTLTARFDSVFGLNLLLGEVEQPAFAVDDAVQELVRERDAARARRDWPAADALRLRIEAMGYLVEDTPSGTRVQRSAA